MCAFAMCPSLGCKEYKDRQIIYSTLEVFYDENEMTLHKKDVFTFVRSQSTDFDFQMVRIQLALFIRKYAV